mmetsp:Transcript_63394/g.105615  ORF Transcript_63394/g.105615 Transcript_63394/m.105615 type:complete len:217 (-) Transcript_63394:223-873(-)
MKNLASHSSTSIGGLTASPAEVRVGGTTGHSSRFCPSVCKNPSSSSPAGVWGTCGPRGGRPGVLTNWAAKRAMSARACSDPAPRHPRIGARLHQDATSALSTILATLMRCPDGQRKNLLSKLSSTWHTSISLARHSESVFVQFRPMPCNTFRTRSPPIQKAQSIALVPVSVSAYARAPLSARSAMARALPNSTACINGVHPPGPRMLGSKFLVLVH